MGNLHDLLLLVLLGAVIASWLKLSRARELAVLEARRYCERQGLQLLDETVGLRAWRLRRSAGRRRLERGYGFEVSIDGDDRANGRLWMHGHRVTEMDLPTVHWLDADVDETPSHPAPRMATSQATTRSGNNVIPFPPRRPTDPRGPH